MGTGGYATATAVFAGGLVVAVLAGLLLGAGGGLALIAIAALATAIVLARGERAAAPNETSALLRSGAAGRPTARALDSDLPPAA